MKSPLFFSSRLTNTTKQISTIKSARAPHLRAVHYRVVGKLSISIYIDVFFFPLVIPLPVPSRVRLRKKQLRN